MAISSEPEISKPIIQNPVHLLAMNGKYQNVRINAGVTEDLGVHSQNLNQVEDKLTFQISRMNPTEVKFEVGRMDNIVDRKINKGGPKRSTGNEKNKLKSSSWLTKGNSETMEEPKKIPI